MLDIHYIRENSQHVKDSVKRRGLKLDIDKLLAKDQKRVELIKQTDNMRSALKIVGKPTKEDLAKLKKVKTEYEKSKTQLEKLNKEYEGLMREVPNLIAGGTPDGGEKNNRVEKTWGKSDLGFEALDHQKVSQINDLVDFDSASDISGSKFYFLKDKAARLWIAVLNFALDQLKSEDFKLMLVPHLVKESVSQGAGFLPKGEEKQIYSLEDENLNLIATSEIPLSAYHTNKIIDLETAKLYCSVSSCYRREAGAYGKYSKGLYRVHQFEKLEMYAYVKPSESDKMLDKILKIEENIYQKLSIPYRVVRIATGDLSAPAFKKFDIEYYSPSEKIYRELTSCSNCTDFQTRRFNVKYKDDSNKNIFAHSLNGTAVTSSRTLIAILENYQLRDGSVEIPKVLQKYYGDKKL